MILQIIKNKNMKFYMQKKKKFKKIFVKINKKQKKDKN